MFRRILYLASIVIIFSAFNFAHNLTSGWQRQDLPNIGGRQISDMCFTDSLNGFMITTRVNDTSYILKTTNSGFNWNIIHKAPATIFVKTQFLNSLTGYVGGTFLLKTTDGGSNWFTLNIPFQTYQADFYVLNEDTIWFAMDEAKTGGVFRTTNGGQNWVRQFYSGGLPNPDKVYFYNKNLGFASRGRLLRTSNGGENWVNMTPEDDFYDIHFFDSLTGLKATLGTIEKTTDGGLIWFTQQMPPKGGIITENSIDQFSKISKDTIYAVGGEAFVGSLRRKGLVFKTTNGGTNWGYQLPDTNIIKLRHYYFTNFINSKTGWAYQNITGGIYTIQGGDSTIYTGIKNISSEIPMEYQLEQNYPNPFNPTTKIKFSVKGQVSDVKLIVYDITGRIISELINEKLLSGTYETDFNATGLSSGVYFYTLIVNNFKETKRMVLLK